jgi:hypothetical protein
MKKIKCLRRKEKRVKKDLPLGEGFALFHYFLDEEGCWVSFFSPFFLPATFLPKFQGYFGLF